MPTPVFTISEQFTGRPASGGDDGPRKLSRTFEVRTDTPALHGDSVVSAVVSAFPDTALGQPHPTWPPAICKRFNADCPDNPLMWEVTFEYEEPKEQQNGAGTESAGGSGGGTGGGGESGPGTGGSGEGGSFIYQPPRLSFRPVDTVRPYDVNGKVYANTAGVPLENPPAGSKIMGTIHVPRRYPIDLEHNSRWFTKKINLVNIADWDRFLARELRITGAEFEPKGGWWEGSWTIEFDEFRWAPTKVLSQGRTFRSVTVAVGPPAVEGGPITKTYIQSDLKYKRDEIGNPILESFYLDNLGQEADPNKAVGENAPEREDTDLTVAPARVTVTIIGRGGPAICEFYQMELADFTEFLGAALY